MGNSQSAQSVERRRALSLTRSTIDLRRHNTFGQPDTLFLLILKYLDDRSLQSIFCACKTWNRFASITIQTRIAELHKVCSVSLRSFPVGSFFKAKLKLESGEEKRNANPHRFVLFLSLALLFFIFAPIIFPFFPFFVAAQPS
jgi:hypothetical protein